MNNKRVDLSLSCECGNKILRGHTSEAKSGGFCEVDTTKRFICMRCGKDMKYLVEVITTSETVTEMP